MKDNQKTEMIEMKYLCKYIPDVPRPAKSNIEYPSVIGAEVASSMALEHCECS